MKPRHGSLLLLICLLVTFPLLTGQGCGGTPTPSPSPTPGPTPDPEPEPSDDDEILQVIAVYGQSLVRLDDLSIWEVDLSSGTALTVGTQVLVGETNLEVALTGLRYAAQRLGIQVRRSSIYQILNFGEVVELLDGSSWRVDGSDQAIAYSWLPLEAVLVVQKPTIGYVLVREADGQYIRVNLN